MEDRFGQKTVHEGTFFSHTDTVQIFHVCGCYTHSRKAAATMGLRFRIKRIMEAITGRNGRFRLVAR